MRSSAYYNLEKRKFGDMSYESKYLLDPKYMTKRDLQHYYRYYNVAKNRGQFKKIVFIIFCICFFSYIFIDYNLKTKLIQLRNRFDFIARIDADYNATQAYFVDTKGCRMPFFPVTDDDIIQFMSEPEKINCAKALTRTNDFDRKIFFNMNEEELELNFNVTDPGSVRCHYKEFRRKTDFTNEFMQIEVNFNFTSNGSGVLVAPAVEFIQVECFESENKTFYKDFHFFIVSKFNATTLKREQIKATLVKKITPKKSSATRNYKTSKRTNKGFSDKFINKQTTHWSQLYGTSTTKHTASSDTKADEPTEERLSVLILGLDSVSHLNFLRQFPSSLNYIQKNLTHAEFWGYNKVGDNTYPNIVPVLTGLDASELNISCLDPRKRVRFDRCTFIWKRFKEAGFQTVYAEDVGQMGLFNFGLPGFKTQPTDYYLRPLMLEMEHAIAANRKSNVYLCMGGRRTADIIFELLRKLIALFKVQDFFSFLWTVTLTHDYLNTPKLLDEDLLRIFELFQESNIFNKTMIFLMTDHGLRWGTFRQTYQGMVEERQPLLMALYPKWLRQKYKLAMSNFELNSKRLTTHFDLHATLLDLLDLRSLKDETLKQRTADLNAEFNEPLPRSISLFLPIPETRTCEMAGIASHWCLCHQREELPTNDYRVQRAARYIIKLINDRLRAHPQCRTLYLNSISEAIIAAPHHKIVKNVTNDYSIDITVRIQAKPGLGLFESTVRMSTYTMDLTGTISRINLYSSQSYCIDEQPLKMFCYCHR